MARSDLLNGREQRRIDVARMPRETLADGIGLLERAAISGGDSAAIAGQRLRLLFERGLEKDGRVVLPSDGVLASCWRGAESGAGMASARRCGAVRRSKGAGRSG